MSSSYQADTSHLRAADERQGKRKWREIEQIKDRQRLAQELEGMDGCFDFNDDPLTT